MPKQESIQFEEEVSVDNITVSDSNVRKANVEEGIEELAQSIKEIGIQQPLVLIPKEGGKYEVLIGQRRLRASKEAGRKTVPAIIRRDVKDETQAMIISFSENIHRLDLEYRDKMRVASTLQNKLHDIDKVAKRLGVDPVTVRNYLGYSAVPPEIKQMVEEHKLGATTALRIMRSIPNEEEAIKIARKVVQTPRSEGKSAIIDIAKEHPEKDIKEIVSIAKKKVSMKRVTLYVTENVYHALLRASEEIEIDKEILIKEVIEEWLKKRGYIK